MSHSRSDSKCPEDPTTRDGGILNIECPECKDHIETSLPYDAEIASIITNPQNKEHNLDRTAMQRPREHQRQCANAHTLSILYDW